MRTITVAALAGLATLLFAEGAMAGWKDEVTEQLKFDHDCEVSYMTGVIERRVDGRRVVFARVHCVDKRAFDVSRSDDFEPFEVKKCDLAAKAC